MYIGILENQPSISSIIRECEIDLRNRLFFDNMARIYDIFPLEQYDEEYCLMDMALAHAVENIQRHGSGVCSLVLGISVDSDMVIELRDKQGFDPSTIRNPSHLGFGYKAFCSSEAHIAHSPDGKSTYILMSPCSR
ncbi:hypothetical protein HQ545_04455 [Candidatus Woesearchaeota archaeon]|nr:hypothetical protein [Candidatus Woesearchaeota archaeon]